MDSFRLYFVTQMTNSLTCSEKVSVEMQKEKGWEGLRSLSGDRISIEHFIALPVPVYREIELSVGSLHEE